MQVDVHDPWCDPHEASAEYGLELLAALTQNHYDAIVLAVAHREFKALGAARVRAAGKAGAVLFDVKNLFARDEVDERL